jgi:hypothetical protein
VKRIRPVGAKPIERGWRVDVPEDCERIGSLVLQHGCLEKLVEHTDAAGLHDDVGRARRFERFERAVFDGCIDNDACPFGIRHVAVTLSIVRVRFVEGDVVPARVQCAHDAAIVGRGAVPVRGHQTRTKKRNRRATRHSLTFRLPSSGAPSTKTLRSSKRAARGPHAL